MSLKIKIIIFSFISMLGVFSCIKPDVSLSPAWAETISVPNPLQYNDVNSLTTQIRSYLLLIVGGIAIVFIAVAGILYIIGGATMNENLVNMSKKALVGAIAGLVVILAAGTLLNEIYFIVLGKERSFQNLSASQILMRLINFLLAIVGTLFLISTIIGGIWYFAAGADESKAELGKKTIQNSVIGLTIAIAALILLRQVEKIITGG